MVDSDTRTSGLMATRGLVFLIREPLEDGRWGRGWGWVGGGWGDDKTWALAQCGGGGGGEASVGTGRAGGSHTGAREQ